MRDLIEKVIAPAFNNPILSELGDSAVIEMNGFRYAFTTDSYVVRPPFFPGGNIGDLAVNGTINDLAMTGARPIYLSSGLILEEGFPLENLRKIIQSMQKAAEKTGLSLVTGDTKVVEKGYGDGIYINTSGIGIIEHNLDIRPKNIQIGEAVIINGDIGRHGIAVLACREGLEFEGVIESDCAPLSGVVLELLKAGVQIRCMRDLTRGGLATALIEIAQSAGVEVEIEEQFVEINESVQGACEVLGIDPFYVANEGRFAVFVPPTQVDMVLKILQKHPESRGGQAIGRVTSRNRGVVYLKTKIGTMRTLSILSGEQLPRIC